MCRGIKISIGEENNFQIINTTRQKLFYSNKIFSLNLNQSKSTDYQ